MTRAFRTIKLVFLVVSIFLCLAIPVAGLVSTTRNWDGTCQGFNHEETNCAWWQFAGMEMVWTSFLFIPLLFVAAVVWLVMAVAQFIAAKKVSLHKKSGG